MARPDLCRDRIDRVRRSKIERAEVRASPGEIGDELGDTNLAEQLAARRIDPNAGRRGDPDIAVLIAFHAVGHAGLELGTDGACEYARIRQPAIGVDVEYPNQRLHGV